MNGSDFGPNRHAQAQTVQTPVQTSHEKYGYLQEGSNPVCAFLSHKLNPLFAQPRGTFVTDVPS